MKVPIPIVCTGIVCITALEIYAMSQGINGLLLRGVVVVIAGLAGYSIPEVLKSYKGGSKNGK